MNPTDALLQYPALLQPVERALLWALVVSRQPERVLEIGIGHGGGSRIIVEALDSVSPQSVLIQIDPEPQSGYETQALLMAHRATLVRGRSPESIPEASQLAGGAFDFVFVDGDHSYTGVTADVDGLLPYLEPGALVLFHDSHHPDVNAAIRHWLQRQPRLQSCGELVKPFVWVDKQRWGGMWLVRYE